jgi:hypothetical protein
MGVAILNKAQKETQALVMGEHKEGHHAAAGADAGAGAEGKDGSAGNDGDAAHDRVPDPLADGAPPGRVPPSYWTVTRAPAPSELIWNNLYITKRGRRLRWLIITAALWWLVIFWSLPVSFLSSLRNFYTLPIVGAGFSQLNRLPPLALDFIAAYLPTLVVLAFNTFLPSILQGEALPCSHSTLCPCCGPANAHPSATR